MSEACIQHDPLAYEGRIVDVAAEVDLDALLGEQAIEAVHLRTVTPFAAMLPSWRAATESKGWSHTTASAASPRIEAPGFSESKRMPPTRCFIDDSCLRRPFRHEINGRRGQLAVA